MQQPQENSGNHPNSPIYLLDGSQTQPLTQEFAPDSPDQDAPAVLEGANANPVHDYGIHPTSYTEPPATPSNVSYSSIELVYDPSCPNCVQVGGGNCYYCSIPL